MENVSYTLERISSKVLEVKIGNKSPGNYEVKKNIIEEKERGKNRKEGKREKEIKNNLMKHLKLKTKA